MATLIDWTGKETEVRPAIATGVVVVENAVPFPPSQVSVHEPSTPRTQFGANW